MPQGAEILTVQTQYEKPCIWALVDPRAPMKKVTIETYGTGHNVHENGYRKYIGTYQLAAGGLIFHCFEWLTSEEAVTGKQSNP